MSFSKIDSGLKTFIVLLLKSGVEILKGKSWKTLIKTVEV